MSAIIRATAAGSAMIVGVSIASITHATDFEQVITRHAVTLHWNEACGGVQPINLATSRRIVAAPGGAGLLNGRLQVLRALSSTPEDLRVLCARLARQFELE